MFFPQNTSLQICVHWRKKTLRSIQGNNLLNTIQTVRAEYNGKAGENIYSAWWSIVLVLIAPGSGKVLNINFVNPSHLSKLLCSIPNNQYSSVCVSTYQYVWPQYMECPCWLHCMLIMGSYCCRQPGGGEAPQAVVTTLRMGLCVTLTVTVNAP